jgi:hypothetical protein
MQLLSLLALTGFASAINTRGSRGAALERKGIKLPHQRSAPKHAAPLVKRDGTTIIAQNEKTASESYCISIFLRREGLPGHVADHDRICGERHGGGHP